MNPLAPLAVTALLLVSASAADAKTQSGHWDAAAGTIKFARSRSLAAGSC